MKRLLIATVILAAMGGGCTYSKWQTLPVEGHNLSTGDQGGGDTIVPPDPTPKPVINPSSVCGNGAVEAGEQCDDGNVLAGDGCSDTCQIEVAVAPPPPPAVCKKGVSDGECSDSSECCGGLTCYTDCHTGSSFCALEPPLTCSVTPPPPPSPVCGNGVVESGEHCDDGNMVSGDGCSATCQKETVVVPPPPPPPPPPPACTPSTYSDGRTAVPLVVTVYKDVDGNGNPSGSAGRFVKETPFIAMAAGGGDHPDGVSYIRIEKGPNYVNMDHVDLYAGQDFNSGGTADKTLYPGTYKLSDFDLNDHVSSLKIVRALPLAPCADPIKQGESNRWTQKIPLIMEIFEAGNFSGESEQVITDTADLQQWGLRNPGDYCDHDGPCTSWNDQVSSFKVLKGPDYQTGDRVRSFMDWQGQGDFFDLNPDQTALGAVRLPQAGWLSYVGDVYNDHISSLYFYNAAGAAIGISDPEVH